MVLSGLPGWLISKGSACKSGDAGDVGCIHVSGRSPEGGKATHSSLLAWRIPWTEEPGGLQSMGCKELDSTKKQGAGGKQQESSEA